MSLIRPGLARESWPAPDDAIKQREVAWNQYEQQVISNVTPQLAEWAKKGKPFIPWASKPEDLPQAKVPAFPSAEGGGKFSFGGRGGKVFVVTNLADSGPGTLREACESAGPRIVVFNVAGIIHLEKPIYIEAPYITIDGHTAPGDGEMDQAHRFFFCSPVRPGYSCDGYGVIGFEKAPRSFGHLGRALRGDRPVF